VHLISFQCVYLAHIRCGLSLVGTETRNASWNVNKLGKSPAGCGAEEAEAKLVDVRRSKALLLLSTNCCASVGVRLEKSGTVLLPPYGSNTEELSQ